MRRLVFGLLAALALLSPALGASVQECTGTNTSVSSATPLVVVNVCNVTSSTNKIIVAIATATTTCTTNERVQMFVGTGSSPIMSSPIPVPGGVTYITPDINQTGCSAGTTISSIAGAFDAPSSGASFWIGVAIYSTTGDAVTWNSNRVQVFSY